MTALNSFLDKWESRTKTIPHAKLYKRSQLKKLISLRAKKGKELSYRELGEMFGVTGCRVSQIYKEYEKFAKKR